MKKIRDFASATIVGITLIAGQAFARPPIYFKTPKINGTGCPQGIMSIKGINTANLSVTFNDRYDAANPSGNAVSKLKRSACSFALPVHVPQGLQVYVITEWRGFSEGKTELHREYFFAGQAGHRKTTRPHGNFVERDKWMHETFSKCGQDILLRINSSVRAAGGNSYISTKKMNIKLKWRRCR